MSGDGGGGPTGDDEPGQPTTDEDSGFSPFEDELDLTSSEVEPGFDPGGDEPTLASIEELPDRVRSVHSPEASATGKTVFAFDRDSTLSVCPPVGEAREAVPIEWVAVLAHRTEHLVYATGNQLLVEEADIPGIQSICDAHTMDRTIEDNAGPLVFDPDRRTRVAMLREVYPDADRYVVVDDVDLSEMGGWEHYFPWDFVDAVREDGLVPELPPDETDLTAVEAIVSTAE